MIAESDGAVEHLCEVAPAILKELDIVDHCEVVVTLVDGCPAAGNKEDA